MRHVLDVHFDNAPETLSRIVRIVSTNQFRLEGLAVSEDPSGRYATLVVEADSAAGDLIQKRLNRVVSVETVRVHNVMSDTLSRAYALVQFTGPASRDPGMLRAVEAYRGEVVELSRKSITVEVRGRSSKITAFLDVVRAFKPARITTTSLTLARRTREPAGLDARGGAPN